MRAGLFNLLPPGMEMAEPGAFKSNIYQYEYFQLSRRVRKLGFSFNDQTEYSISFPVPYFSTEGFLTENLTHITWTKDPRLPVQSLMRCTLFLDSRTKSFNMMTGWDTDEDDITTINIFLDLVSFRASHLEHFEFQCPLPYRDVGHGLSKLLASLTMLKTVRIKDVLEFNNRQAASAASSWPHMRKLGILVLTLNISKPFLLCFGYIHTKCCPDLRNLEINDHPLGTLPPGSRTPFPKLRLLSLSVGVAKYSRRELASFPAEITPSTSAKFGTAMVQPAQQHDEEKYKDRLWTGYGGPCRWRNRLSGVETRRTRKLHPRKNP